VKREEAAGLKKRNEGKECEEEKTRRQKIKL
jgi:hypothetical protein